MTPCSPSYNPSTMPRATRPSHSLRTTRRCPGGRDTDSAPWMYFYDRPTQPYSTPPSEEDPPGSGTPERAAPRQLAPLVPRIPPRRSPRSPDPSLTPAGFPPFPPNPTTRKSHGGAQAPHKENSISLDWTLCVATDEDQCSVAPGVSFSIGCASGQASVTCSTSG